jgi:hypothetical protein
MQRLTHHQEILEHKGKSGNLKSFQDQEAEIVQIGPEGQEVLERDVQKIDFVDNMAQLSILQK